MVSVLLLMFGCSVDSSVETAAITETMTTTGNPSTTATVDILEPARLLSRISLDLRGIRPSPQDISAVVADPSLIDEFVDTYLYDERFEQQIVDLYSSIYLTRQDTFTVGAANYSGLSSDDEPAFAAAVGEEPLRILAHIAANDLPYTEVVTGDWTMATPLLAAAWNLKRPSSEDGWARATYTDGRPSAGVLSTNGMWWRYGSNTSNGNRGRANAITRIFTCNDYLKRVIAFDRDINLLDEGAVNDALKTNPGCVSCHITLDPISSHLWGFLYYDTTSALEISQYHPERELLWQTYTEVEPGWLGESGYSVADLGRNIAADNAFVECAVEQATSLLLQRDSDLFEITDQNQHRQTFIQSGLLLRDLMRSVIASEAYRAAPNPSDPLSVGWKMVTLEQFSQSITALTGYTFTFNGYDMMTTDSYGLRTLGGGIDGLYVSKLATAPTSTMLLVHERFAQAAASYLLQHERANPDDRHIFTEINLTETFDSDASAMTAQIQRLHLLLFGDTIAADGPELDANRDLWNQLYEVEGSVVGAWTGLLSVLFRDPMYLFY